LGTGSLGQIEKKLDQLIQDVKNGNRGENVCKKINIEVRKSFQEKVHFIDIKPGHRTCTRFTFENVGLLENGIQPDVHLVLEELR
jgi:hypothetical protein